MSAYTARFRPLSTGLALFFLMVVGVSLSGCRTAPIRDMGPTPTQTHASAEQVKKAIFAAGAGLGWMMKEQSPTVIVGTLALRDHLAVVEIPYSATSFSIRYKDSQNLRYNASDKTIHSNYNGWVENLNNAIIVHLSAL